jgi:hypothetical protein
MMMKRFPLRCLLLLTVATVIPTSQPVHAADAVTVEIRRPLDVWNHPLVASVRTELYKSRQFQSVLATPQYDRVRLLTQLIERGTGESWEKGLAKLTAGGAVLTFSPGKDGGLTLIVTADNAKTMQRFVTTARDHVRSRLPEPQRATAFATVRRDGVDFVRVGTAAYAVVGPRLVFASSERRLLNAVKQVGWAVPTRRQRGTTAGGHSPPYSLPASGTLVRVTIDAAAVRNIPQVKKALQLPAENTVLVALLGGWSDLLRRSKTITGELTAVGNALEFRVRGDAKATVVTPGLEGFFADGRQRRIAPLLQLPDAIYAASWYRDYRSLWDGRAKLLAAKPLKKLEEGNETLRQQFSVIGGKALPSRMFSLLGPHIRVVAVRQQKSEYAVEVSSRTPTAGLVVDLRDEEAFRKEVTPLFRAVGLLLTVNEAKMATRKSQYKGAELISVGHRDDPVSAKTGNRLRFNLNVTYAVTRGHLVAGTTRTIVERLIDELDRQARERTTLSTTATEIQRISLAEAAAAVKDFQPAVLRQLALDLGLSVAEGKAEVAVVGELLKAIGSIRTQAGFDDKGFEYRVRVGKSSP